MLIDIVYDPVCPWCYIGKRRMEQALSSRPNIETEINWHPFLLNPELPPEGIDRTAYLVHKFGSEARVRRVYGAISDLGLSVEIGFNFDQIRRTANTLDAHRLVRLAEQDGKADSVVEALFSSYFTEGKNIGNRDVLGKIAEETGLNPDVVMESLSGDDGVQDIMDANARAHRLGVNGVPTYVFNGTMLISGAQETNVLCRIIDAAQTMETEVTPVMT